MAAALICRQTSEWRLSQSLFGLLPDSKLHASVQSCLEQLFFEIYFRQVFPQPQSYLARVAGFITLTTGWQQRLEQSYRFGTRHFKVKIGRADSAQECQELADLVTSYPGVLLRIDANQQLSNEQILPYILSIGSKNLDFIEEPRPGHLEAVRQHATVAIDESQWLSPVLLAQGSDRLVVKSQRLPYSKVLNWLAQGILSPEQIVLSSCFDSSVGLRSYLKFAYFLRLSQPFGFGTFASLQTDSVDWGVGASLLAGRKVWL